MNATPDFPVVRKGLDPVPVRAHLAGLDQTIGSLERQIAELQSQLSVATTPIIQESDVAKFLGAESAQLLTRAHDASKELTTSAERRATQALNEANADAARMRREAHQDSEQLRQETASDCAAKVEAAEQKAYQIVADAEEQRRRIFSDVELRRDRASRQLRELMAGRDRLVDSIAMLRSEADNITADLDDFRLEPSPFANLANSLTPKDADVEASASAIVRGKLPTKATAKAD